MRVRDDDVLLLGKGFDPELAVLRLKDIHRIIVAEGGTHVAALLCKDLHTFPGAIEFIREAYQRGELIPEIHGWEHVDYGLLSKDEVTTHLGRCFAFIVETFHYQPLKFYTPWGSNDPHIQEACELVGLEMVDTSRVLYPKRKFFAGKMWEEYSEAVRSERQELFVHWWDPRWLGHESHSLVNSMRVVRDNDPSHFN